MKKLSAVVLITLMVVACNKKKEVQLSFTSDYVQASTEAEVDITYPKAIGNEVVAKNINQHIEQAVVNLMNMAETPESNLSIAQAISGFDNEYKSFKNMFGDDGSQVWEVYVDGYVVHESPELICISLDSYIDTGGAHGNGGITYLNFNPKTGDLLGQNDLINDLSAFKKIAEKAFKDQTQPEDDGETIEDFFFGEAFQLPSNIGFSKENLILLYNNYEIASYAQGITEIEIPYGQLKDLLKVTP